LAKSTVHRLATTLIEARLLEQNPQTCKYHLGLAVFELGACVANQMDVAKVSVPYLEALMERTGETVHLAIIDEGEVLYINKIESRHTIRMYSRVGRRGPVYCTGVGKAMLAFQEADKIEQVIAAGMVAHTEHTLVKPEALQSNLAEIRKLGYAIDDEEIEIGLRCVAAPVSDHTGKVIASISVAGPSQRLTKERLLAYAPDLVSTADTISQRLGYREPQQTIPYTLAKKEA
jgi:DNA-binding IclR family transcriptional regulator